MSEPPASGDRRRSPRLRPQESVALSFTLGGQHFEAVPAAVVWARPAGAEHEAGASFPEELGEAIRRALLQSREQRVLVVEDDLEVRAQLTHHLGSAGFLVATADGAAAGLSMFQERAFDLVVMDLGLPDGSGMRVLEGVRAHPSRFRTPVIILTADASTESRLSGLAFGADQYLTKPVDYSEFLFYVSALLRRARYAEEAGGVIDFGHGAIDPGAHVVRFGDKEISNLSRKEFDLLYGLIAARPKVLSRQYILSKLWHTVLSDNTVETHIRRLRAKLGDAAFRVVTVPGKGYKFI